MNKPKIGCIIMASGASKRFGGNKLLAAFHHKPLFTYVLENQGLDCFSKRLVLTRTKEIHDYCQGNGIPVLMHELTKRNEVVSLGMEHMEGVDACMFCLCDQPLLSEESIRNMIASFEENGDGIYRLSWNGEGKSPVLFSRNYFPELKKLPDKKGGGYLAGIYPDQVRLVEAQSELEIKDIDTPEDLLLLESEQ